MEESEEDMIDGKPIVDTKDEKLISFKSANLLNSMLPYAQNGKPKDQED
jgi:hypothetical protein